MEKKISCVLLVLLFSLAVFCLFGCKKENEIPTVIFDTDIGSSADDLFARQMLCRYVDEGKVNLLGIVVDRTGEKNARIVDLMNTFYGHPEIPVGIVKNGLPHPKVWIDYSGLPDYTDENGEKLFDTSLNKYDQLPDGYVLYRKLLANQKDKSVTICSVGFLPCLTQLLSSAPDEFSPLNGQDLVRKKVKVLILMGGVFGQALEKDFNFAQGIDFSKRFFELLPSDVDVIFSPAEVGDRVEYRPENVISDISWTDVHPIKQVYMNCNCNTGQRMWDVMAVLNAVNGNDDFLLSQRGFVTLTDNAETIFTPDPKGNCRYQLPRDKEWNDKVLEEIRRTNY